jgi:hypothetical protein
MLLNHLDKTVLDCVAHLVITHGQLTHLLVVQLPSHREHFDFFDILQLLGFIKLERALKYFHLLQQTAFDATII